MVRILDHGAATTVIGPSATRRFDGESALLLRAVLDIHARPMSRRQLFEALAVYTGQAVDDLPAAPIDELVALLAQDGVLVAPPPPAVRPVLGRRVVLGISGAVAASDTPAVIRGLHAIGVEVRVALTRNAARMVSRAALEALTHQTVWTSMWQRGAPVPHIALAAWAEAVVICPASATTIARIAHGDASELVAAIAMAARAPVVIVPSMNEAMYVSPAVQDNLQQLREHGRYVAHPALGVELADAPADRLPMLGAAPPASAVIELVRHVLREVARAPENAHDWEQLWARTPAAQMPWYVQALEPAIVEALAACGRGRLLDVGTGDGVVAIAAADLGFQVTASDLAPSALGAARRRAGGRPILLVLDDITASRLDGEYDVIVDRGTLHVLSRERREVYAAAVRARLAPGGAILIVAHVAVGDELAALFPGCSVARGAETSLAGSAARLYVLRR